MKKKLAYTAGTFLVIIAALLLVIAGQSNSAAGDTAVFGVT